MMMNILMYDSSDIESQARFVESLDVEEGTSMTLDCPFCGGSKKFTVTRKRDVTLWNCYRSSCDVAGATNAIYNKEEVNSRFKMLYEQGDNTFVMRKNTKIRELPKLLIDAHRNTLSMEYMKKNNCLKAYNEKRCEIKYSPKDNRILFLFPNSPDKAVGRALYPSPAKWINYGDVKDSLFIIPGHLHSSDDGVVTTSLRSRHKEGIICEDVPSAIACSNIGTFYGISILGTHCSEAKLSTLVSKDLGFTRFIVVLDKDAKDKALKLANKLQQRVEDTTCRFLPADPKVYERRRLSLLILEKTKDNCPNLSPIDLDTSADRHTVVK